MAAAGPGRTPASRYRKMGARCEVTGPDLLRRSQHDRSTNVSLDLVTKTRSSQYLG
jgi:hypothetical protein